MTHTITIAELASILREWAVKTFPSLDIQSKASRVEIGLECRKITTDRSTRYEVRLVIEPPPYRPSND